MNVDASSRLAQIKPMTIGEIIGTAWRLYRTHFGAYVVRSLYGSFWLVLPLVILLSGALWMLSARLTVPDLSGPLALILPAWVVLFLWCNAQSLGEFSVISRSVYRSLKTPPGLVVETMEETLRVTRSRRRSLLGSAMLQWLILGTLSVLLFLAVALSLGMIFVGMGLVTAQPSSGLFLSGGALFLGSLVLLGGLLVWLSVRFLVTEQTIVVETGVGAIASIGRSWQLMKKTVLRAIGLVILVWLICLPIFLATFVVSEIVQSIVLPLFDAVPSPALSPPIVFLSFVASTAIDLVVSLLGGIITSPLFRAAVTTLYFDIRNRKESIEA